MRSIIATPTMYKLLALAEDACLSTRPRFASTNMKGTCIAVPTKGIGIRESMIKKVPNTFSIKRNGEYSLFSFIVLIKLIYLQQ